jgi:3-phosphoshikimate 1-carboxyvinyltransferase
MKGSIALAGDKSIAHRAVIVAGLSRGKTKIENFPAGKDCLATLSAFRKLGIPVQRQGCCLTVYGQGLKGLRKPREAIFVGDSGTTARLLLGVLAAQRFASRITGGKSLSRRPMLRVTKPLRMMGAQINAQRRTHNAQREEYLPIKIKGSSLKGISYKLPIASAQVKSALLFAGLFARGKTQVSESIPTRDHTERILKLFKADIKTRGNSATVRGGKELRAAKRIYIPADISSAAFFIVAGLITPDSRLLLKRVGLNPTRAGLLRVLRRMGAQIEIRNPKSEIRNFEPMGDIIVKSSKLKGTVVKRHEVPSLIDELPILMLAACLAQGQTRLEGVGELRFKETDRIRSMSENLRRMGADIRLKKAGKREDILIRGTKVLTGARVRSFGDHRTAMSMLIAGLAACGRTTIDDISCIDKSFPGFLVQLRRLTSKD